MNMHKLTFVEILTLIFITLKLLGEINWSWWLVFAPMLIKLALICLAEYL